MKEVDINKICEIEFNEMPREIVKKTVGMCNEVYEVTLEDRSVILRMNKEKRHLYGTHKFLPIFEKLQINTPHIIAEDYSMKNVPFCYQILNKIEGNDLGTVIDKLNEQELKLIAKKVSGIFNKFNELPKENSFGNVHSDSEEEFKTLLEVVKNQKNIIVERNSKTGVVDKKILNILDWILNEYEEYFLSVESGLYYDDISSKNVMIYEGKFNGLVDLDFLTKGDYLEAIGSIMASWYGTDYGEIYTEAVMKNRNLDDENRKVVKMYAILHLIYWLSEEGIQFNSNTSSVINWDNVKDKEQKIIKLFSNLNN